MVTKIKCPECDEMKNPLDFVNAEVFSMCRKCDERTQELFELGEELRPKTLEEKEQRERENNLHNEEITKIMSEGLD